MNRCPDYAFRCKYGACVDKTVKCNGKKDCVDGSDENLPECNKNSQRPQQTNATNCPYELSLHYFPRIIHFYPLKNWFM